MRVLFVTASYYPFSHLGGPPVSVRALAEGLRARGHDLTILTVNHDRSLFTRRARLSDVEVIYLGSPFRHQRTTLNPAVVGFCAAHLREFDVVHIFGLYDLIGVTAGGFAQLYGIPYVVEPFGMFPPIERSIRAKQLYLRLGGRRLLDRAGWIITTSDLESTYIRSAGISSDRMVSLPHGVDVDSEHLPAPGRFRERIGVAPQTRIILFLGRLTAKKQPEVLLRAFARLPGGGIHLVFAGPSEDGWDHRLENLADELHLGDRVTLTGMLEGEEKLQALVDADIFVLPSRNENFGIAVAEAMACSTPVVVSDQCGIAQFVKGRAGLVVSPTEDAVGCALSRLLEDAELYSTLARGAAEVAHGLTWDESVNTIDRLYRELTGTVR